MPDDAATSKLQSDQCQSGNGQQGRLIIDGPSPGAWNMAVDEALLTLAAERGQPTLRFYQWSEPTVSLGYFQTYQSRGEHQASRSCPLVRRNSGGGAIVHDQEITYSLTVPGCHPIAADPTKIYLMVHKVLVDVLESFGITATLNRELRPDLETQFLCFQRRAVNDVLVFGKKICGSAQRKKHNAISQHGSCIINTSVAAPEIAGVSELANATIDPESLVFQLKNGICDEINFSFELDSLSDEEQYTSAQLEKGKFNTLNGINGGDRVLT